jgi:predicted ester cyclase
MTRTEAPHAGQEISAGSRETVRRLLTEAWGAGNVDLLDELIDAGYRSHIAETNPIRTSHHTGPTIPRTEIAAYRSGIPNLRVDVTALLADAATVVAVWTMSGDNTAEAIVEEGDEKIPPSGRPVATTCTGIFTVEGSKITDATYHWDPLGPLSQLRLLANGAVDIQLSDDRVHLRSS